MDPCFRDFAEESQLSQQAVLRSNLSVVCGAKDPLFEDGPNSEGVMILFHGFHGVVPLSGISYVHSENLGTQQSLPQSYPLDAKAATISLSAFGFGGPFSFHSFSEKWENQKPKSRSSMKESTHGGYSMIEAMRNECLQTGTCPIAKSYGAVSSGLSLGANALKPSPGIKLECPPAVVAARAALAQTASAKNLCPQPLPTEVLAIGVLGMAVNGILGGLAAKFLPFLFAAIHAADPFIAMLGKCVLMPKTAMVEAKHAAAPLMAVLQKCFLMRKMDMVFIIGAFVLGLLVGSIAVRCLLKPAAKISCKLSRSEMVELELEVRG